MHIYFVAGCWHFDCLVLVQNYYHSCSIPAWDLMEDRCRSMVIFRELLWILESKGTVKYHPQQ